MINEKIAQIFTEIAEMLQVAGENPFRARAYERAAETVRRASDLTVLRARDMRADPNGVAKSIESLPGIGEDLYKKILEIMDTGECKMHERLKRKLSPGILDILHVRGIGPKKARLFLESLGVDNVDKLKAAAESGALATLPGMGKKSESSILEALASVRKDRIPYKKALAEAEAYLKFLRTCDGVIDVQFAGSLRRKSATIGDIDLLATAKNPAKLMKCFLSYPRVTQMLSAGETKGSVVISGNIQVDLRIVGAESFGAAMFYFTGPRQFNIHVRTAAQKRGLKVNEYGIFKGRKCIAGRTEEEMFSALGMKYLSPMEREDFK